MIEFYKDNLVPPELCRLLYEAVPKQYHVPVRFHNRRQKDRYGRSGHYPLGSVAIPRHKKPSAIDINLNPIYNSVVWPFSKSYRSYTAYSPSSALWRLLLEVCLHEFGHVASKEAVHKMNQYEYRKYGRVYEAIEELAEEWKDRRIAQILAVDPRLGQPKYISGYLGARLIRWGSQSKDVSGDYPFIIERRCQMTGGQLTSGDTLRKLNVNPYTYTNAYTLLKRASEGIGIDYVDRIGRHHKLYTWGDVPLIAKRFDRERLREKSRALNEQQGSEKCESCRLEGLYRKAADPVLRTRLLVVWRMSLGDSVSEVAEMVGYSRKWVREIARRYKSERGGSVERLVDRRHSDPGAKDRALLDEAREAQVGEILAGPTPSCAGEGCVEWAEGSALERREKRVGEGSGSAGL